MTLECIELFIMYKQRTARLPLHLRPHHFRHVGGIRKFHVLANQEDVDCAQIELVEEGERREAFFCRMHTGIEL
jgi:hypothetical protein